MQTILFSAAALLSLIWLGVHLIMGGREIAAPLRASRELRAVVADTAYVAWHMTSAAILIVAVFFGLSVMTGDHSFALSGSLLAFGLSAAGVFVLWHTGQSSRVLPQGWLFVPIWMLGLAGLAL